MDRKADRKDGGFECDRFGLGIGEIGGGGKSNGGADVVTVALCFDEKDFDFRRGMS